MTTQIRTVETPQNYESIAWKWMRYSGILLIPLAWGDSGMFDMKYFPLARTVMGGLLASTVLTLIVLPTYYTLFDDLGDWMSRVWTSTRSNSAPRLGPKPAWR